MIIAAFTPSLSAPSETNTCDHNRAATPLRTVWAERDGEFHLYEMPEVCRVRILMTRQMTQHTGENLEGLF